MSYSRVAVVGIRSGLIWSIMSKVVENGFADRLGMHYQRRRGIKGDSKFSGPVNW